MTRIEGHAKVTGAAHYTGDLIPSMLGTDRLLHAAIVTSTCAAGSIANIDTTDAQAASGVHSVLTHTNAPRLKKVKTLVGSELDFFLPLQDNRLRYYGQPVALVVADTLLQARHAASLVEVDYASTAAALAFDDARAIDVKKIAAGDPAKVVRGKPDEAFEQAAVQLDLSYTTASAHHNAMEPGASIASWDEQGRLTVWTATQFVFGDAMTLGEAFDLGPFEGKPRLATQLAAGINLNSKIRVIAPLIGGAFGSKATGGGLLLAAMAAKLCQAPVKVVLTREQTYALMPYRSAIHQRVRLGADREGCLSVILHDAIIQNSHCAAFVEPAGEITPHLYASPHLQTTHKIVRLDVNSPGWMRAPGPAPGLFALECAMDELAERVRLDPVELRLRNYAHVDPATGHKWSSKSLKQCYRAAAERIGWADRNPEPCSTQEDGQLIGYGMASAMYRTVQFPAVARLTLLPDGSLQVESAAHEIGQGALTAFTKIAAESLGVCPEKVNFQYGDTRLPFAFITAGSSTTLSVGSAIKEAGDRLRRDLILRAITDPSSPLYGFRSREVVVEGGRLFVRSEPLARESLQALLARHPKRTFRAKAITGRLFGKSRYGRAAFGAQFVKVAVDSATGQVRVRELVGAFAGGRIINQTTARSQLLGGMVWGIGHALFEETKIDQHTGSWVNSDLAEALVPTNSDVPSIDAILIEEDDSRGSALGAKGIGEIGIVGVAAAIANAVYHATGQRFRDLPLKLLPR